MMDFFFILLLWLVGVLYDVMAKVRRLKKLFPQFSFSQIWNEFLKEEWDSLFISFVVLVTMQVSLAIVVYNEVKLPRWLDIWGMYVIAIVLGYAGQRIAYRYLGTAADVLEKKADQIGKKFQS